MKRLKAEFFARGTLMGASFALMAAVSPNRAEGDGGGAVAKVEEVAKLEEVGGRGRAGEVEGEVRFVSWNLRNFVRVGGPLPADGMRGKPREEVSAVVEVLAAMRPDVLGVCEVGSEEDLGRLQELLAEEGVELPHREWVGGADPKRHLALLSRYPVVARASQTGMFYQLDGTRFPVQRGMLDVTVEVRPGWQLRCCGVHLKSRRDTPEADEGLMRRNEAHLVRKAVDAILKERPEVNLLVYGDFNDTRDAPALRAIRGFRQGGGYLTEISCADDRGERWTFHYPEDDAYTRIDFLLASAGLAPEVVERECAVEAHPAWRLASDHRPLLAVIRGEERVKGKGKRGDGDGGR